jgi:hypothetical protein
MGVGIRQTKICKDVAASIFNWELTIVIHLV